MVPTAGWFDSTFGTGGKVTVNIDPVSPSLDQATAMKVQADGKIVVAGSTRSAGADANFGIVRLNPDGSLDSSFGNGGTQVVAFDLGGSNDDIPTSLAIDSSGRIVVAGYADAGSGSSYFAVTRLNADGSLDTNFGVNGLSISGYSGGADRANAVAIDPQGRIVLAGDFDMGAGKHDIGVVRLNDNGWYDSSFGGGGRSVAPFTVGSVEDARGNAVTIDRFGRIVVAASVGEGGGHSDFGVVRLTTNGWYDGTFGSGGQSFAAFSPYWYGFDRPNAIAIDSQDRIVVAGTVGGYAAGSDHEFGVARLTANGYFDTSFGSSGKRLVAFHFGGGVDDGATGVAIDRWGRVVLAGYTAYGTSGDYDYAVARLTPDGVRMDPDFGIDGKSTAPFDIGGSLSDKGSALALDAQGRIVVAGTVDTGITTVFGVCRIDGGVMGVYNPYQPAPNGISYTQVVQGSSSTCWIAASIAEVASHGVDLSWRIAYQGSNQYLVSLFNRDDPTLRTTHHYHPITEVVTFDGTLYSADPTPRNPGESWVVILQRGIIQAISHWDPSQSIQSPHSGGARDALAVLTGQWGQDDLAPAASGASGAVIDALNAGRNVVLHTNSTTSTLVGWHVYAVLNVNYLTIFGFRYVTSVTLYNPWGSPVTVDWSTIVSDGSVLVIV
jgi:uncharacterized delta-60 repeat protein